MALNPYLVSLTLTQPTLRVPTGSLRLVAAQGSAIGPLTLEITQLPAGPSLTGGIAPMNAAAAGASQYAYEQSEIPAGQSYRATIHDAGPPDGRLPDFTVDFTLDPAPVDTRGCTDPQATNYLATASSEDGSCQYAPFPPLAAFFQAPLLQSLRFAARTNVPLGPDGALFCEQPRAGQQLRPYYFQLVEQTDPVRLQVFSSYAAVTATVSVHGGGQVGPVLGLGQVLQLEGPAAPLAITLSEDTATGLTRLTPAAGTSLPTSLLQVGRLTLAGAATGTYRVSQASPGTASRPADSLLLNRPWVAVGAGAVTATWQLTGPGFNVFEADLPVRSLGPGTYTVQLRGHQAGWPDAIADSEPFLVRETHADTVAVDFSNVDNAFGGVFSTGHVPRVRVRGTFFRQKSGGGESNYRDSRGNLTVLSATAQRLLQLETYQQPAWMHEKLFLACKLDFLQVAGLRCQTDQAYEVADERNYPLAAGKVFLEQAGWLGAGNGDDAGLLVTTAGNVLQLYQGGNLQLHGGH